MEQLLKITNVPIMIEMKVNNAKLEYQNSSVDVEIGRDKGGLQIKSNPIKLNVDTFEARNSVVPTAPTSIKQYAEKGKSMAYEATATLAKEGQLLVNAKLGEDALGQIVKQRNSLPTGEFTIDFIPKGGAELSWSKPDLTIAYQMDKLNFDWKVANGDFEFIPGNIEISIAQHPDVVIEYVGSPIYVPPSADPNYTPIDVMA